ncbi:MAG TPA: cupredoxin domain-containing protein [Solirubrobacterales bacterium]|nr:cupredoxin domain-containing protein [Solirubrobacterales bacterium]
MKKTLTLPVLALAACMALLVGCGGGDDTTTSTAADSAGGGGGGGAEAVKIVDFKYIPPNITVPAGTTVSFDNEDSAAHTATSKESGAFDTGTIEGGASGKITLKEPGTFAYICAFHPFMKGTIVVK